jgi:hypothetical protein
LEIGGKESRVGPGFFLPEAKETIHHHYNALPSGEMSKAGDYESDSDSEDEGKKVSK